MKWLDPSNKGYLSKYFPLTQIKFSHPGDASSQTTQAKRINMIAYR